MADEINTVFANDFNLKFTIPTAAQLASLRRIERDRGGSATSQLGTYSLAELVEAIDSGEIDMTDLSPSARTRLAKLVTIDAHDATER